MPHFTELNAETSLAYAHALAAVFGRTLASTDATLEDGADCYLLDDGSTAAVWFDPLMGCVYGEA